MTDPDINLLKKITSPYAYSNAHVQGPGGNTSVKVDGNLIIKASGFTFKDVAENNGVVWLNNDNILKSLYSNALKGNLIIENPSLDVIKSVPTGLKPSMEFEFHALLNAFVLHTHCVYTNIITCATTCAELLGKIFTQNEYLLLPYLTPGFPIANYLMGSMENGKPIPSIIFLQNHGIIVHGCSVEEVLDTYNTTQHKIIDYFNLQKIPLLNAQTIAEDTVVITNIEMLKKGYNVDQIFKQLVDDILIPDQSILFKNNVSIEPQLKSGILLDIKNERLILTGTLKFIEACKAMLETVFYIKKNIADLGLNQNFIPVEKLSIIHGLNMEKYRISILQNH